MKRGICNSIVAQLSIRTACEHCMRSITLPCVGGSVASPFPYLKSKHRIPAILYWFMLVIASLLYSFVKDFYATHLISLLAIHRSIDCKTLRQHLFRITCPQIELQEPACSMLLYFISNLRSPAITPWRDLLQCQAPEVHLPTKQHMLLQDLHHWRLEG
jgi:hypothetical protein